MKLPEVTLDDRDFQGLVDEARRRISRSCPEWTDHNVSDPGITLVELFAWMTELTIYRLNRVPEKIHVALMELLGIRLDPSSAANAALRFRLAEGVDSAVRIPAGTEVGTPRTSSDESIIFQVGEDFEVAPLRLAKYLLERDGQVKDVGVADGEAKPTGPDQLAFGSPPQTGDGLYLGFTQALDRLVLRVSVKASAARGAGVDPDAPPLLWEVSAGDGTWAAAEVLEDLTGGFNYGTGTVELQLPKSSGTHRVGGHQLYWVRCRIAQEEATYSKPPAISEISAKPIGALLDASHSVAIKREVVGLSDGTPGQTLQLRSRPVLPLKEGETLEVQDPDDGSWQDWEVQDSLATSEETQRHFSLDLVSGELELGPAIRQTNGVWKQYGAIPPKDARLRMSAYRHGGGQIGNVAAGTLTMLKTSLPGVDRVTNPAAATGGVDAQTLETARRSAGLEIRARNRAVTVQDYEFLAKEASVQVARALCIPPRDGGPVELRLLRTIEEDKRAPHLKQLDRPIAWAELEPDEQMYRAVGLYLDERRLIGTQLSLQPVRVRGVSVTVELHTIPTANQERVRIDVEHALYVYLNPLIGGSPLGKGEGWPFGRPLTSGELYGIVYGVRGVAFVEDVRIREVDLASGKRHSELAGSQIVLEPDQVIGSGTHTVKTARRVA